MILFVIGLGMDNVQTRPKSSNETKVATLTHNPNPIFISLFSSSPFLTRPRSIMAVAMRFTRDLSILNEPIPDLKAMPSANLLHMLLPRMEGLGAAGGHRCGGTHENICCYCLAWGYFDWDCCFS